MPPILQIKTQGFPSVINDLGIQSPIRGPFWGFEPTVVPTYQIGSTTIQKQVLGLPYPSSQHLEDVSLNPGASATLIQSANLAAGIWAFQLSWVLIQSSVDFAMVLYKVRNSSGTVLRTTAVFAAMVGSVNSNVQDGVRNYVEEMNEGDNIFIENLRALSAADLRTTLKFVKLSNTAQLPTP